MFSLESPHGGNSYEYTIYHFQYEKENHPELYQICSHGIFFSKGLKNEFETAMVNELLVFKPLKFYCIYHVITYTQSKTQGKIYL